MSGRTNNLEKNMPVITKIGLISSLGWVIFCAAWIIPMAFDDSWNIFNSEISTLFVIVIAILVICGVLLSPILLIIGLFRYPKGSKLSQLIIPFFMYILSWVTGCALPFTALFYMENYFYFPVFMAAPIYAVIFSIALLVQQKLVK